MVIETFDAIRAGNAGRMINALGEIPGPSSPVQMLGNLWVEEVCDGATAVLRQGMDVLRPIVLEQEEDEYREDVVGLVQTLGEQPGLSIPESRGAQLLAWLNDLLHERPTDLTRVGVDAVHDAEPPEAILDVVQTLEGAQLRTALGTLPVPSAVPLGPDDQPVPAPRPRL